MNRTPPTGAAAAPSPARRLAALDWMGLLREYAVLVLLVAVFVALALYSAPFLSPRNLLNVLAQNAPLAIIAAAGTLVIVAGGFDLSTGAIVGVANVCAAWIAVEWGAPALGLAAAPLIGLLLGALNGVLVTRLRVHSFLATLASSLVFTGLATLITGGNLIPVADEGFTTLGRGRLAGIDWSVITLVVFAVATGVLLAGTRLGRHVYAVGGNRTAAALSGVRTGLVAFSTFAISGLAAGVAAAILVSRIASGQPEAGVGMELQAIAAVILGGTSIYGGVGAVWRSVAGVLLLALIDNGFNILNLNPFYRDLTTGLIIVSAVALSAAGGRRRRTRKE